ncbi:MAG TPA: hypothetical protein VH165_28290 [Kofleriaceae bacterium]|jgi:uncharacterized protein YhhL (DUF1145 family)|nr:hypothetical protein [Kofleriaceae bacterium]
MSRPPFVPSRLFRAGLVWPLVIVAIIVAELALGWHVYHTGDVTTAMVALLGVPVLAVVDYLARLRPGDARTTWYRRYLALWCLVPFMSALAGSFWVHYQKRLEGLDDIRQLAVDVKREVAEALHRPPSTRSTWGTPALGDGSITLAAAAADPPPIAGVLGDLQWVHCNADATTVTAEDINTTVLAMFTQRFTVGTENEQLAELKGESNLVSEQARRFVELARVVGRDLRLACGNIDVVYDHAESDTLLSFGLALTIQALFVLWIPVMLAIAIARAYNRGRHPGPRGVAESLHCRDARILAEDRYLFVPRFCFGALLVLGTNYVFSPFGLKATYIMAIVDEHALPGHPTWVLWSTSFAAVPVLVVGFVGFLLYAVVTASQRFALDDLDDSAVLSLLVRGLVVILLCFALSSSPMNETVSRIFVFLAGVFPLRALEALAKKANIAIDPDFDGAVSSFDGLPSLDPSKVFALRSAGIQSTYDLAATPIEEIAERVRIDPRLLGRAVDRAILIDAIGLELARRLEPFAITSATELVALKDNMPPLLEVPASDPAAASTAATGPAPASQLHDAAARVAERLACDLRVTQVRTWLAGTPYFEGLHLDPPTELLLKAAGFETTEQLVAMPLVDVARRARVDPCTLGLVIDAALLVSAVGPSHAQQLAPLGIQSATDLMEHTTDPAAAATLGETFSPVIERLGKDPRVAEVRRWLACAPRYRRPPTNPVLPAEPGAT